MTNRIRITAASLAAAATLLTVGAAPALAARPTDPGYVFYEPAFHNGQTEKITAGYDSKRNNSFCIYSYGNGPDYPYSDGSYVQSGPVGTNSAAEFEAFCLANYPNRTGV
jgi:hypothetical protein